MRHPRTSFVLPVRNGASTLEQAIASICAQTDGDFELLVVDDHSTDESTSLTRSHPDPRVRLLTSPGRGIVAALNHGISMAAGTYIARMDADDLAVSTRLEYQLDELDDPRVAVVDSQVVFFADDGEVPLGMQRYAQWVNRIITPEDFDRELLVESPIVHPAATFRREVVQGIGGYRDGPFPEDYDLWLRLHAQGLRFKKIPQPLVKMRDHHQRLTRTDPRYSRSGFRAVRQEWLARTQLHRPRTLILWGAGKECRPWLRWLLDQGHSVTAIVDVSPRLIGNRRRGVPIIAMDQLDQYPAEIGLVLVGARGARELIRQEISQRMPQWHEGVDWWAVR